MKNILTKFFILSLSIGFTIKCITDPRDLYLDLMKKCLINSIYEDKPIWVAGGKPGDNAYNAYARQEGIDWPSVAHTMIGLKRLNNIQFCVQDVIDNKVPGDLIETGVWRGGATIFMRAILKANNVTDRIVWVADSFAGLPVPNIKDYPQDQGLDLYAVPFLAVSLETVKSNFKKYDLLDNQVAFLKGWFKDTLPKAPIDKLAVMRLDGDLYESTMDALKYLYPKLSIGGYIIIDDFYAVASCAKAVNDYRRQHKITDKIEQVDITGVFWKKTE